MGIEIKDIFGEDISEHFYNDPRYTKECKEWNFSHAFSLMDDHGITTRSFIFSILQDPKTNKNIKRKMYEKIHENDEAEKAFLSTTTI